MNWNLTEYNAWVKLVNKNGSAIVKLGDGGHLNSIYANQEFSLGQMITILYAVTTITGQPVFKSMDGGAPANFSPMICKNTALDGRWYVTGDPVHGACALLQPALDKGQQIYAVKLKPQFWQDVNGKQDANGFKHGVADARILEIVFGGKFRGHGVQVFNGRAKIELKVSVR